MCTINEFISVYWNGSASVRAFGQLFLAADMALEAQRQQPHRGGVSCQMFFFPSCFAISLGSYDTAAHEQGENTGEREGPSNVLSFSTLYA